VIDDVRVYKSSTRIIRCECFGFYNNMTSARSKITVRNYNDRRGKTTTKTIEYVLKHRRCLIMVITCNPRKAILVEDQ